MSDDKDLHPVHASESSRDFRNAFWDILAAHAQRPDHDPVETLAIAAYCVGQLVASMPPASISPKQAMDMITGNVIKGNHDACAILLRGASGIN